MILRPYQKEDAATICSWIRTEDELYRWSADRFNKFPLQASDINQNYAEQLAGGRFFPLTAVDEEGHIAGHFIIRYPREKDDSTVRFGFVIVDPTIRGKGYGKEMLLQGVRYVREHNLAPRIDLGVFANNDSARHCYEAVGFKEYRRRMSELPIGTWECIDMELVDPIEIRIIDAANQQDINIPNQPFPLFGRMLPSYQDGKWSCTEEAFPEVTEMCFPDEHYDYDAMAGNSIFLGAYDHGICIGLAILQKGFFRYMYLYDFKVNKDARGKGIASRLIEKAKEVALQAGYRGIYTIGQDNNLGACRFYIKNGFRIGGLDTEVYKGTNQEGKADILFYLDC